MYNVNTKVYKDERSCIEYRNEGNTFVVAEWFVKPEYRGSGIGRSILHKALKESEGCEKIVFVVGTNPTFVNHWLTLHGKVYYRSVYPCIVELDMKEFRTSFAMPVPKETAMMFRISKQFVRVGSAAYDDIYFDELLKDLQWDGWNISAFCDKDNLSVTVSKFGISDDDLYCDLWANMILPHMAEWFARKVRFLDSPVVLGAVLRRSHVYGFNVIIEEEDRTVVSLQDNDGEEAGFISFKRVSPEYSEIFSVHTRAVYDGSGMELELIRYVTIKYLDSRRIIFHHPDSGLIDILTSMKREPKEVHGDNDFELRREEILS